jgi:AcrR family transcriptional regulator
MNILAKCSLLQKGDSVMSTTRREEIIEAFIKVGSRKGLDYTTMQDVAKAVGISVGTIYLDFKNKEELIDAFGKRVFREFDLFVERILKQSVPAEKKLHDLLVGDVEFASEHMRENQSLFEFFHNDVIKHIKKSLKESRLQFEQQRIGLIKQILEAGVQEGGFVIDNVAETARLFFIAYGSNYFRGPFILERKHEEVVKDAEAMFAFLLKSIKRP